VPNAHSSFRSDVLRRARCDAGLTVEASASELGRSPHTLRGWESGRFTPPVEMVTRAAALYGTPVASFFADADPAVPQPCGTSPSRAGAGHGEVPHAAA
jgi:transcriptional regulator with XRE-family HTH domain